MSLKVTENGDETFGTIGIAYRYLPRPWAHVPTINIPKLADFAELQVVGTSEALEKPFLRLTQAS